MSLISPKLPSCGAFLFITGQLGSEIIALHLRGTTVYINNSSPPSKAAGVFQASVTLYYTCFFFFSLLMSVEAVHDTHSQYVSIVGATSIGEIVVDKEKDMFRGSLLPQSFKRRNTDSHFFVCIFSSQGTSGCVIAARESMLRRRAGVVGIVRVKRIRCLLQGDDPPYLSVGTEVSAKYKGAFCEAKIRKVVRSVKCRVTYKQGLGTATVADDQIKGTLRVGASVEARHGERKEFVEATITKIQDCSQYTVVFDDGDITTLRRTALCLKSGRHFAESETLDQLPLTHPEHFGNPVIGGRRGRRSRQAQ